MTPSAFRSVWSTGVWSEWTRSRRNRFWSSHQSLSSVLLGSGPSCRQVPSARRFQEELGSTSGTSKDSSTDRETRSRSRDRYRGEKRTRTRSKSRSRDGSRERKHFKRETGTRSRSRERSRGVRRSRTRSRSRDGSRTRVQSSGGSTRPDRTEQKTEEPQRPGETSGTCGDITGGSAVGTRPLPVNHSS